MLERHEIHIIGLKKKKRFTCIFSCEYEFSPKKPRVKILKLEFICSKFKPFRINKYLLLNFFYIVIADFEIRLWTYRYRAGFRLAEYQLNLVFYNIIF